MLSLEAHNVTLILTFLFTSSNFFSDTVLSISRANRDRVSEARSSGFLDDPDDDEYEYMNKQTSVTSLSSRHPSHLKDNPHLLKVNTKQTPSISTQEVRGGHTRNEDKSPHSNSDSEQQGSQEVEYEYMDIRGCEKEESPLVQEVPLPTSTRIGGELGDEKEEEGDEDYVEDSNYQYTNRQPKLRRALQDRKELKIQGRDEAEAYEYEDMDAFAAMLPGDTVVYQNLQREGEGAVRGTEAHRSGFDPYLKVRAGVGVGVGEPASADRSFDNPDYWHSRMFLKPKAVRT